MYYPSDVSEFMEVIQDPGQVDATDPQQKLTYPLLIEYCKGLYTLFDNAKPRFPNLTANKTRTAREMAQFIANTRGSSDKTEVFEQFRNYTPSSNTKVYLYCNDSIKYGYDVFLARYAEYLSSKIVQKTESRSPSDGI